VCQAVPQELAAAGFAVGRYQLAQAGFSQGDHRVDGLAGALDRLANDHPNRFSQPEILGAGERDRQHRHMVVHGEVGKPFLER